MRATPTIYEARGEFQLDGRNGAPRRRRRALRAIRAAQGEARRRRAGSGTERKRALPAFPRAVGIVTSRHAAGAARRADHAARGAMPALPVILYPAAVQGRGAAAEIAAAIATANARAEVDVLIVCRGGGSIEDLWAFNEEVVARAVFESVLPIVSGVGHETDFTICDFVADVRAPTPTAAAALVAPDRLTLLRARRRASRRRWRRAAERALESRMQRVDLASRRLRASRGNASPTQSVALANWAHRLRRARGAQLRQRERESATQGQRLAATAARATGAGDVAGPRGRALAARRQRAPRAH